MQTYSFNYRQTQYNNGTLIGENSTNVLVRFFNNSRSNGYNFFVWVKKSYLVPGTNSISITPDRGDFLIRPFDVQDMTTDQAVKLINQYYGREIVTLEN